MAKNLPVLARTREKERKIARQEIDNADDRFFDLVV
jgi:hypothetical protein